jgi:WD40 repeat protein
MRWHGGTGGGRGHDALIVVCGVLVTVLSAWLPSFQGGVLRGLAVVGVGIALAITRRLERAEPIPRPMSFVSPPRPQTPPFRFTWSGPSGAVEKATGTVVVDGRRAGTATVVAAGLLVTTAQIRVGAGRVTVRFRDGYEVPVDNVSRRVVAGRLALATLRLAPGTDAPAPVGLWPARRLPTDVIVFGHRTGGRTAPHGTWRTVRIAGDAEGGLVALDDSATGGALDRGSVGGPVCDPTTGLMVGLAVEGTRPGRLDRMLAVGRLRELWPPLPRPWLLAGEGARAHFAQRAMGQRSVTRGGDLFRGRAQALRVVEEWISAPVCPGVPLVITAQPGAGKSTVLARALLAAEARGGCDGVGFHARQASVGHLVDAIAAACGLETPASWKELVQDLATTTLRTTLVVMVDALDEAVSNDITELRVALRDLARLDWARVVVTTRPLATGEPFQIGGHLHTLGVTRGIASTNLVDLDADRFSAAGDLHDYAAAMLTQAGFLQPGPPGAAWQTYRADPALRDRLAALVAARAGRNYLVAGMSAFQLAESDTVVDPATPDFEPSEIPRGVGEALSKYLDSLPDQRRRHDLGLLTALAYGRGVGLDDRHWIAFARALGRQNLTHDDLDALRESAAADYLLETNHSETGGRRTRLFHQALSDELLALRNGPSDERRLLAVLRDESTTRSWLEVSGYARRYAPSHAAAAGTLDTLLDEADFLAGMLPVGLRSVLGQVPHRSRSDPAAIYDLALRSLDDDPGHNAAVLEFISHAQGNDDLAARLAALDVARPWRATGKVRPLDTALAHFDGHTDRVWGIVTLEWPGLDHPVVVTASVDGSARVWDPQRPDRCLARFDGHTHWVVGVATLDWPGIDHAVVVTTSADNTARVWDPRHPEVELARFEGHSDWVAGVAALRWPGVDHSLVVTVSVDRTARVWDPLDPNEEIVRFTGHTAAVAGVATLEWPDIDHPVVVTTSRDGTARVWDPQDPDNELARFTGHTDWVVGVTAIRWPGVDHEVLATGSSDGSARVWDPQRPGRELARFHGQTGPVVGVASLHWPALGHAVVVTTSVDGSARVWDPQQSTRNLGGFDGHDDRVWGVVSLDWPGLDHPVVATGSSDGTARVWDPHHLDGELARFEGHTGWVVGIGRLEWPGMAHPLVVTTSFDGTARVWDPVRPEGELACFAGHEGQVWGVTSIGWPDRDNPVVITTSADGTARIWDPRRPQDELARFERHDDKVWFITRLDWPGLDHPVVVTTSSDGTARVWDPQRPNGELARFERHDGPLGSAASLDWPGLDHPVVVTTSADETARVWDPLRPDHELARFDGHTDRVVGVIGLDWPGIDHQVVATTSIDGTVRVWDPQQPDAEMAILPVFATSYEIAKAGPGHLAVATNQGLVVLQLHHAHRAGARAFPGGDGSARRRRSTRALER